MPPKYRVTTTKTLSSSFCRHQIIAGKGREVCGVLVFVVNEQDGRLRQSLRRRRYLRILSYESISYCAAHLDRVCFQVDNDMPKLSDAPREQFVYPISMLI